MDERSRLLEEIAELEIRLMASGLPEQTSSLLDYDLTLQQLRAFAFVFAHGETSISNLGEALGIKPNVATGIIQRLVDRELVERLEDPQDRRVRRLTVTDRGLALIEDLSGIVLAKSRLLLERLDDERLRQLRDIFSEMYSEG